MKIFEVFCRHALNSITYFLLLQTADVNVDDEVAKITQSEPYMLLTGSLGEMSSQIFICCEQSVYLKDLKNIKEATYQLIATYFVYDIQYPKPLLPILIFLQHYVVQLKDKQPIPPATVKLLGNLEKF